MSGRVVSLAEVEASLVDQWRRLGQEAVEPNPFAQADFVLPASRWVGSQDRIGLLVVERDKDLRFVLPVTRFRQMRVPAIGTWNHAYSFLGTPLLSPRDVEGTWGEALGQLQRMAPWVVLEQVASDGPVVAALADAQSRHSRPATALALPDRPILLGRPDGRYLDSLSGSRRSKLKRLRPRLGADMGGEVRVVDHGGFGEDLDAVVDDFLAMEARGWKGRNGGAMACHRGHGDFFREMCRRFAEAGSLQLRELKVGTTAVAYQCNLVAGDTVFGFKMTFDEQFRRYSPGVVLIMDTISAFHAQQGLAVYDSCMDPQPSPLHDLFSDRRSLAHFVLPRSGVLGSLTGRVVPPAVAAYRHIKRRRMAAGRLPGTARMTPEALGGTAAT